MRNQAILITYPDSLGGNLKVLKNALDRHFAGAISGVHNLPLFPSSADRGFAPTTYQAVDPAFGTWDDVKAIAEHHPVMLDFMINHISAQSACYQDFLDKKDDSEWRDLFIRYPSFWPGGEPTEAQVDAIYKRKPRAPYVLARFADGTEEKVWCTFSEEQVDLNCESEGGKRFIRENLVFLAERGAAMIRLDAFAYAIKRAGGSCFFEEPGVWDLLRDCADTLAPYGTEILPEIHEHYTIQQKLVAKGYPVYDFALPMLLLNAIYFGNTQYLAHWLNICPRRQYTTLDTHDGIGVVDVRGLMPDEEIDKTKDHLFDYGANVKRVYNTAAYNNLDIYQVNCTYYSALGEDDEKYLLARAVQVFTPGIPQVYYVGLLAGRNDLELLERTKTGRDINRHYYSLDEVAREAQRPVVKKLLALLRFRNASKAFDGEFSVEEDGPGAISMTWKNGGESAELRADFKNAKYTILRGGEELLLD
jgi:sucrose phosphorylase